MASVQSSFSNSTHKIQTPGQLLSSWNNTKGTRNLLCPNKRSSIFPSKRLIAIRCSALSGLEVQETDEELSPEDSRPLREIWREIQGENDWENLLDPMNSHLRREIVRYGEMAQACYDSFDFDPHSKYCGTCKYQGAHFFERLGMADRGYTLTRFLYATSNINLPNFFQKSKASSIWSQHANWMGYVAVATDEEEIQRLGRRDIIIAWRGTVTYLEWIHDLKDILHPAHFRDDPSIKIESGFFDLYTSKEKTCKYCSFSAREQVLAELRRIIHRYRGENLSITITGHSLGAALALLSAYDIAEMKLNIIDDGQEVITKIPITVFSFSGPRVGNLKFKERCDELGIKVLRVINVHDKVPAVPGIITNEKFQYQKYLEEAISFPWSYAHVGVELTLDHTHSPFLRRNGDIRDIALVNKSCDFLKSEYGVPPYWWQDEHKGMVRTAEGRWTLPERPRIEAHPPDTAHHFEQVIKYARAKLEYF
ncbi:Phospholipase A1-Igamma3, chloroplastic [Sesamum alatum]|uniref:Phospholipase A1-Igamma3, chloroplastic n=1 Tax=Sesamum alatum TaxID=300844 RepID=A0AAE2CEX8_9LAMI|nr:Phospholipase A1-Igamma3, chloroplastic [Sesamum alatum]